jgi:glucokinase
MAQPKTTKTNRIICDLGRTRVRLALNPSEHLLGDSVIEWATDDFDNSPTPIIDIFKKFIALKNIEPKQSTIMMSVPTHIVSDHIRFFGKLKSWHFSIDATYAALGVRAFRVTNDMVALGFATPLFQITAQYQLIGQGVAIRGAPILIVGIRSGVGATCMVLTNKSGSDGIWLPLQSEGGHIELAPRNQMEADLLAAIAGNLDRTPTVSDVLSAEGTILLYKHIAEQTKGVVPDHKLKPIGLKSRSLAGLQDSEVAAKTIEVWCGFLGSYAKNLALAFGAHGGIYIAGPVPIDLLGGEQTEHHSFFRDRFTNGGPGGTYLSNIPTALITHKNPYLLGLGRIHL